MQCIYTCFCYLVYLIFCARSIVRLPSTDYILLYQAPIEAPDVSCYNLPENGDFWTNLCAKCPEICRNW